MELRSNQAINQDQLTFSSMEHIPVAFELEMRRLIEREAYLNAEKDGFRKSPDFYWATAKIDLGFSQK